MKEKIVVTLINTPHKDSIIFNIISSSLKNLVKPLDLDDHKKEDKRIRRRKRD